jgi:hypothetical protein
MRLRILTASVILVAAPFLFAGELPGRLSQYLILPKGLGARFLNV